MMNLVKEMNLLVLQKALEDFNGNRLYTIVEGAAFTTRYDFYTTDTGVEVWSEYKVKGNNVWSDPELENIFQWEELPEEYRRKLGAK